MRKFICRVCTHVFTVDDANTAKEVICPVCGQHAVEQKQNEENFALAPTSPLEYSQEYYREDSTVRYMDEIHRMAVTGKPVIEAMGTQIPMPSWDSITILGCQIDPPPLDEHTEICTTTIIGKNAKKPMVLDSPVFVSHMSFGALSREAKIALAKGSAMAKTAMCSGEGGILPEEMDASYKYIFEYVPNKYSVTPENLKRADAIEIKIGQGTKPGMGGHLPGDKVTAEIAEIRKKSIGKDIISPSKFPDVNTKEELKELIKMLRFASEGRPIGVKIASGRLEKDLACCIYANADFVTIDGRGGATGASPKIVRDATSIPTIYALYRARKFLDEADSKMDLIITGGLRVASDVAKALAMGADGVALASSALMALGCQQYRICGSGKCPVGIATQNEELRKRLDIEVATKRVANFLVCTNEEIKTFARITAHENVHELCIEDIATVSREISEYTNILHC